MSKKSLVSVFLGIALSACGLESSKNLVSNTSATSSASNFEKRFFASNRPPELCLVYYVPKSARVEQPNQLVGYLKYSGPTGASRFQSREEVGLLKLVMTYNADNSQLSTPDIQNFKVQVSDEGDTLVTSIDHLNNSPNIPSFARTLKMEVLFSKRALRSGNLIIGYAYVNKHEDATYSVTCRL